MKVYVLASPRDAVAVRSSLSEINFNNLFAYIRTYTYIFRHHYRKSLFWFFRHKVLHAIVLLYSFWEGNLHADISLLFKRRQVLLGLLRWSNGSTVLCDRIVHRTVWSRHLCRHVLVLCLMFGLCGRQFHHSAVIFPDFFCFFK